MQSDSAGSNPRLCLEKQNRRNEKIIFNIPMLFCPGH